MGLRSQACRFKESSSFEEAKNESKLSLAHILYTYYRENKELTMNQLTDIIHLSEAFTRLRVCLLGCSSPEPKSMDVFLALAFHEPASD